MADKPINIAVLSTAHIHTRGFLDNLKKGADGRAAYAVWDDVAERGKRYATDYGARFVPDLAQLVADPKVDGFLIAAENTRHFPLLEKAIPAGKPVMCEKPLTTRADEAQKIAALVAKHRTPLICGYFQPFSGEMRAIAQLLAVGRFGRVTTVKFRNAHHAAYGRWFDSPDLAWFTNPELSGGGALMDMGTHAVHLLRSLFGPVEAVSATIANRSGAYPSTDDHGVAQLRFAAKHGEPAVLGTVEASWILNGGYGGLEIQGTKAALWHDGRQYVIGAPGKQAEPVRAIDARPATVDRLIALILGQLPAEELAADLDAMVDAVAIMQAAYASNAAGSAWTPVARAAAAAR